MISFVACTPVACRSGRALAAAITVLQRRRCRYYSKRTPPLDAERKHVNYGYMASPLAFNCLNIQTAVELAADKYAALKEMRECEVRTPEFWDASDDTNRNSEYTRIFRKANHHSGSDNPYIVEAGQPATEYVAIKYDYGMRFIRKSEEYRVHIFCDEAIRIQRKRRKNGVERDANIWSSGNGWVPVDVDLPDGALKDELVTLARNAVDALCLHFGAVDIIRSIRTGLYVLEVNTAPGLVPGGVERYAQACVNWDRGLTNGVS